MPQYPRYNHCVINISSAFEISPTLLLGLSGQTLMLIKKVEAKNEFGQHEILSIQAPLDESVYVKVDKSMFTHEIIFNAFGETHYELPDSTHIFQL